MHLSRPHASYDMYIGVIELPILEPPVSGVLGLAWETVAISQRLPFWQMLASNGAWDEPLFAVQLTRSELCSFGI